jgi:hypothetical protein
MNLHFFKTELAARVGAFATGAGTGIAFLDQLDVYVRFAAAVVALFVGIATLSYYVLANIEKWRNLRK